MLNGDTIRNAVPTPGVRLLCYPAGMPRLARAVLPDFPHHVTQRGNRRQQTFFCPGDYVLYMALMAEWCHRCRVDGLVAAAPLLARVDDWSAFLGSDAAPDVAERFHKHEKTGRPLGTDAFVEQLEGLLDRVLRPCKPGPVPDSTRCGTAA